MFLHDGHTRQITKADLVKGRVIRDIRLDTNGEQVSHAFSDCVIVDVHGETVKLARPYCYVASADTCCPTVLTGVERFEISPKRLCAQTCSYKLVVMSTGEPAKFTTR